MADPLSTAFAGATAKTAARLAPAAVGAAAIPGPIDDAALAIVGTALVAGELAKQAQAGNIKPPDVGGMLDGLIKTVQFGGGETLEGPTESEQPTGVLQEPLGDAVDSEPLVNVPDVTEKMIATVFPDGADEFLTKAVNEFPLDSIPDVDPVINTKGTGKQEPFPIKDEFGNQVDKFNYYIDEDRTEAVSQMHNFTAGNKVKPHNLIRGFTDIKNKAFGSRIKEPEKEIFLPTAEELAKTTFESLDAEFKMAQKFFTQHPEFEFFVPSLTNADVGVEERLDLKRMPKERIFKKATVMKERIK
jgi:hypothetical protein